MNTIIEKFWVSPQGYAQKLMFWLTFINNFGTGLYVSSAVLYFVNYQGFSAIQTGVGLSIGGAVGLLSGIPVGMLSDRKGARETYLVTLVIEALSMAALLIISNYYMFVILISITSLASVASSSARGALVRELGGDNSPHFRAGLRSVNNLGITFGGALAGIVITIHNQQGYLLLIVINVLTFIVCAGMVYKLPKTGVIHKKKAQKALGVLRDRRYLAFSFLVVVFMQQYSVLPLALPLWLINHTMVPRWTLGLVIPLNTIMVVGLQVLVSRWVSSSYRRINAAFLSSATFLLISFVLIGLMPNVEQNIALVFIITGLIFYSFGELWFSAVSYELSFLLAPHSGTGEYQGMFSMAKGLGRVLSPIVVTGACLNGGTAGWVGLGVLMLLAGVISFVANLGTSKYIKEDINKC
ncbi:MFS transporter [Bacillus cereus group sp. BceL296]|uniref:MFS transporter n=1 Tax=Bacillus cereus group TaxID=86661 RepID=UPI00065BE73E|nr:MULTISPECIES: MFS transporter [Bacillus cereus group]KMQ30842.1 hypothetical protein TU69_07660 [Bacillus cereus]MCU5391723.1 MFS transporter [Bacillus paranthracis]MDA1624168.1 MFS transporter [Bacillus cereus group sp. TH206-1LC]MDA1751285.1 MFS transporter [Bacillus cereus group sp. LD113LC]MDA1823446.1 MFS transporter [Bacillus cereus group sp. BY2-1LC]